MIGTIRARLTLWYMLLLFLTLALFGAVTYLGVSRSLHGQFDRAFTRQAQRFADESRLKNGELSLELKVLSHGELVAVYDTEGDLLVQHDGPPTTPPERLEAGFDSFLLHDVPWRRITLLAPHLQRWLQVSRSQEELDRSLHLLFWFLAAGVPTTVLIAGAGGLFLASRLLNPLDRITRTAAELSAERLSSRLPLLDSRDELARLVETFNAMLARLDEAFARQKQFTSDAAHELRTPLARLLTRAEVTLGRPRTEAEYRAALEEMRDGAMSLSGLLAKLLSLARDDADTQPAEREPLELAALIEDAVQAVTGGDCSTKVRCDLAPVTVVGDQTRLTELVVNLLDNALRHGPEHGRIDIRLQAVEAEAVLWVSDRGPGVPPEQRERIFERFYQVEQSRHSGGVGLGLAICRAIAEQHGGTISLDGGYRDGARFVVRLPLLSC